MCDEERTPAIGRFMVSPSGVSSCMCGVGARAGAICAVSRDRGDSQPDRAPRRVDRIRRDFAMCQCWVSAASGDLDAQITICGPFSMVETLENTFLAGHTALMPPRESTIPG